MIGTAKPYAEIGLGLAQDADRSLGKDAKPEQQAAVVAMLAGSPRWPAMSRSLRRRGAIEGDREPARRGV